MNNEMNTYNPADLQKKKPKKSGGWKKGLIIFLIITVVIVGAGVSCNMGIKSALGTASGGSTAHDYEFAEDYIGVLNIRGTIVNGSNDQYDQQWLLDRIEQMKNDSLNQGMILNIDTPGGSAYATDEVYLKIKEYQKQTKRPVYTYMESMAASGGYYMAAASDKIYANRNTWTGSIGVTVGTFYDLSGFLDKMGVKTVTIDSGANKSMGSSVEPMTREQKDILQGLVDEAYEQFVGIVAEGRDMKLSKVKKLADGRIYTAKQAKENGLIDEIGELSDAVFDMKKEFDLDVTKVETIAYEPKVNIIDWLTGLSGIKTSGADEKASEYAQLQALMEENNTFTVSYLSQIRR